MKRRTILIVDDEGIILLSLKRELQNAFGGDFDYETALSAEEAETLIGELDAEGARIVLVISDWLMPGMKGDELLRRVHEGHPDIKTMIISGQADQEAIRRVRDEAGLGAYISKPWKGVELMKAVRALIVQD
ncbi:MAG: response regulator [Spirochaetota bacterium]